MMRISNKKYVTGTIVVFILFCIIMIFMLFKYNEDVKSYDIIDTNLANLSSEIASFKSDINRHKNSVTIDDIKRAAFKDTREITGFIIEATNTFHQSGFSVVYKIGQPVKVKGPVPVNDINVTFDLMNTGDKYGFGRFHNAMTDIVAIDPHDIKVIRIVIDAPDGAKHIKVVMTLPVVG